MSDERTLAPLPPPGNPNGGPKSKRTEEVKRSLLQALADGCTHRAACAVAGISQSEFYEWKAESTEFMEEVTRAENAAEAGYTKIIQQAALRGDWKAAESWLKRRRRADWGDNVKSEISGPDGGPIPIMETPEELSNLPADELIRRYRESLGQTPPVKS